MIQINVTCKIESIIGMLLQNANDGDWKMSEIYCLKLKKKKN